ncbi:MAG: hypothetical protein J2P40_09000 [Candidatus Dormibacteraeota bacterium]|nr:hypothetical protein [Candidatus Dormibacteraeota bacterium]MBO0761399.1 hypothetical protein [Candidatus Dormibacteraeota bacterium]
MRDSVFCGRCGAPLIGVGAACTSCGAAGVPAAAAGTTYPASGRPSPPPAPRRPVLAGMLGAVPGLGHLYLGHRRRALLLFGGFVALELFGADLDLTAIGAAIGVPLELGGFGVWLFSMWDAFHTGRRALLHREVAEPGLS